MASPFTRSGATAFTNGPGGGGTDVLSTLPAQQAKGLGSVTASGVTPPSADYEIGSVAITVPATAGGSIELFLLTSTDGSHWAGGLDPTSIIDQSAVLAVMRVADPNLLPIDVLTIPPSATTAVYAFKSFFILAQVGGVPTYFALLINNDTDVAFTAASALYRGDTYA